jgi:hypothetical protein
LIVENKQEVAVAENTSITRLKIRDLAPLSRFLKGRDEAILT